MSYGGEDAFFISPVGGGAIGVADGVGGWANAGINPAGELPACAHVTRLSWRHTRLSLTTGRALDPGCSIAPVRHLIPSLSFAIECSAQLEEDQASTSLHKLQG